MEKIVCVYKLTNTVTGKFYIGSTLNFKARMKYHRYSYSHNANVELGSDIAKYGWSAFSAEILEECTPENVRARERYYIDTMHAVENGYNMVHATNYHDLMSDMNARNWKDPAYRERRSEQSSAVQRRRLSDPAYLAEKSRQLKAATNKMKKPVAAYSKEGKLVARFGGVREAERWLIAEGVTQSRNASSAISDACDPNGRHKTAYGYIWKYDETRD